MVVFQHRAGAEKRYAHEEARDRDRCAKCPSTAMSRAHQVAQTTRLPVNVWRLKTTSETHQLSRAVRTGVQTPGRAALVSGSHQQKQQAG